MTLQAFISKLQASPKHERRDSHRHFPDLCRQLDFDDPANADSRSVWFTIEKGASKTGDGMGWADVWRKGCVG